ncbi:MAG: phosphotransferase family protein [Acidimicrobiia bacterium]
MSDVGVDLGALAAWMDREGLGSGPLTEVDALAGGTQNVLVAFTRSGRRYVLRHPPLRKRANSDETMRREARLLAALKGTSVPHPALIAACGDESVLGSAFYLMEPVAGVNANQGLPPGLQAPEDQRALGFALVDALVELSRVDHVAVGLADFGRPEGWHARQVARWRGQLEGYSATEGYDGPDLPGHEEAAAWLEEHQPEGGRLGLIHGDFHFANVIVDEHEPVVRAVVDWELASIGDPLLDLGHVLATWPTGGDLGVAVPGATDLPSRDEALAHYRARTDADLSNLEWFRVLACYRLAVILEGTYARARAGMVPVELGDRLHRKSKLLLAHAVELIAPTGEIS